MDFRHIYFLHWLRVFRTLTGSLETCLIEESIGIFSSKIFMKYGIDNSSRKWKWKVWGSSICCSCFTDGDDSRLTPSQWETSLQIITVSHRLGANLESTMVYPYLCTALETLVEPGGFARSRRLFWKTASGLVIEYHPQPVKLYSKHVSYSQRCDCRRLGTDRC